MKRRHLVVLMIVTLAAMGSVRAALADVAPPAPPPGASVDSGNPSTYVQMVSESVVMTITDYNGPSLLSDWCDTCGTLATDRMVGHVQAYFKMVNQGTATETFNVYFPLVHPTDSAIKAINNLTAYVDGQISETQTIEIEKPGWGYEAPWAIWKVTFAPGQTVNLGVVYDVYPQGWELWGSFTYILETGADWYGPIGEGTITIRLPYEVNELNTVLGGEKYMLSPNPAAYTISGTDIVWHFNDLEPAMADNVQLTVLTTSIWRGIQQAQGAAQAHPGSIDTQLQLAHTLFNVLEFKHDALICCKSIADEITAIYERTLELDPDNPDIYVKYLTYLETLWWKYDPSSKPEQFDSVLREALAVAPHDTRLRDIQSSVKERQLLSNQFQTETAPSSWTPWPTETPYLTRTPYLYPTSTPAVPLTPTLFSTSAPVLTTTPPIGVWAAIGAVLIGGAGVGVWVYRKRKAT